MWTTHMCKRCEIICVISDSFDSFFYVVFLRVEVEKNTKIEGTNVDFALPFYKYNVLRI